MERKIGETFEYEGKKLQVVKDEEGSCDKCFFFKEDNCRSRNPTGGICNGYKRTDKEPVIFVEVKDEQPQEQAEQQKLNLCEILKYCPQGETFWSPMLGDVKLYDIDQEAKTVDVAVESGETWDINTDGTITIGDVTSPEVMLYPSREQRDWTKVKYEPKKERFDPHTLKPFDKVIARKDSEDFWNIDFFSCFKLKEIPFCLGGIKCYVIPYNDDTKHLVGTMDDVPDFYRYWED